MVVDGNGLVHVAAQLGSDIYYVTNATGRWTREQLSQAAGRGDERGEHTDAAMARDEDGSLWVAFADRCAGCAPNFSEAVYLVTNGAGNWADPVQIPGYAGESPLLDVTRGTVQIADTDTNASGPVDDLDDIFRPIYLSNASGQWSLTEVGPQGTSLAFHHSAAGRSAVIFSGPTTPDSPTGLHLAVRPKGAADFEREAVQGSGRACDPTAAFGADGSAFVFWEESVPSEEGYPCSGQGGRMFMQPTESSIGPTEMPYAAEVPVIDVDGAVHALARVDLDRATQEVWYFTNRTGSFDAHRLATFDAEEFRVDMALAIGDDGRPHVFLSSELGTWYAVGPAS